MTTRKIYEESEYYVKEYEMRDGIGREFEEKETWHRSASPTFKGGEFPQKRFECAIERPFRSRETTFNDSMYSDRHEFSSLNGQQFRQTRPADFYEPVKPKTQLRRYYDDFAIQCPTNGGGFSRDDRRHQTLRPVKSHQRQQQQQQQTYSPIIKNHPIYQSNVPVKARPVQQQPQQQDQARNHKIYQQSEVKEHKIQRSQSPVRKEAPIYQSDAQAQIYANETYFPLKQSVRQHEPSNHDQQHFQQQYQQHHHQQQQQHHQQHQQQQQPQSILRRTKSNSALNVSSSRPGSPQSVAGAGDIINTEHGFTIQLDVKHFRPADIKVNLTGSTLTVTGDRVEEDRCSDQALRRQFSRKYAIPVDIMLESIKSHMTDDGFLFIRGNRKGWKETDIQVQYDDEKYRRNYRKTTMSSKSSVISNV